MDEAFYLVTKDIVMSFLSRRDTLLCSVWESQAIGYWIKDIQNIKTFADNGRIIHLGTGFNSKKNVLRRKEICHSVLAVHKSYPNKMRVFWRIYQKEDKTTSSHVPPISYDCQYPLAMDYMVWRESKLWFSELKLCKDNPTWNRHGEYKGRQGSWSCIHIARPTLLRIWFRLWPEMLKIRKL